MKVYVPKKLLSEPATVAAVRLEEVGRLLKDAHTKAEPFEKRNRAHAISLKQLQSEVENAPERDKLYFQARLEQYAARVATWEAHNRVAWDEAKAEVSGLEDKRGKLERYLADFVAVSVSDA